MFLATRRDKRRLLGLDVSSTSDNIVALGHTRAPLTPHLQLLMQKGAQHVDIVDILKTVHVSREVSDSRCEILEGKPPRFDESRARLSENLFLQRLGRRNPLQRVEGAEPLQ